MRSSIKSFLILLFLTAISLSNVVFAGSVSITDINPLPATVYKGTTVYGSYLLKAHPGQHISFKNKLSPWVQQIPGAPGDGVCYNGITLSSTGQCTINLKLSAPALAGVTTSVVKAGLAGNPSSFTQRVIAVRIIDPPPPIEVITPIAPTIQVVDQKPTPVIEQPTPIVAPLVAPIPPVEPPVHPADPPTPIRAVEQPITVIAETATPALVVEPVSVVDPSQAVDSLIPVIEQSPSPILVFDSPEPTVAPSMQFVDVQNNPADHMEIEEDESDNITDMMVSSLQPIM